MKLNINTALITSKQRGNENIAVISNYFWFDYSLKPYVSCIDAVFTESEEQIGGRSVVNGYFIYSLLNIAHNHSVKPDTHYPTVLGENESEKSFSATPIAKKGLSDLFINILPSTVDGFAVSYRLVSDGVRIGFGVKSNLRIGKKVYEVYPRFSRIMKLPDEDLLIKRANFPVRVRIEAGKNGKKGGDISVELPTLIDGLFSKTLNKHIGIVPERVLNSPRLEHLPQDWITWTDYRPVVCGKTLNTYELITPPDEDVLEFVSYLKNTYNKPVYLLVSVELLIGCKLTYFASVENVSQFINSLPVDGVVIQDDFSEGSWVAGTVNLAISSFLRNLYSQVNKTKFYLPSYSTVKYVSFQDDTVSISTSRNQLFNETNHGCIYTPPLIPFKECGYIYGGYNANTCDHANYYLQEENEPILKHKEFMQFYPSLTFIAEQEKMYKPPNLLLSGLNNVILKQHFFDGEIGLVHFPDAVNPVFVFQSPPTSAPLKYTYSDFLITYNQNSLGIQFYIQKHYVDGNVMLSRYQKHHALNFAFYYDTYKLFFFVSPYLGAFYLLGKSTIKSVKIVRPVLVDSPVFAQYPVLNSGIEKRSHSVLFYIDFQDLGRLVFQIFNILSDNASINMFWIPPEEDVSPEISAKRRAFECQILRGAVYIETFLRNFKHYFDNTILWRITWFYPKTFITLHNPSDLVSWIGGHLNNPRGFVSLDIANMREIHYLTGIGSEVGMNQPHVWYCENDISLINASDVLPLIETLNETFFSTVLEVHPPHAIEILENVHGCLWKSLYSKNYTSIIEPDTCSSDISQYLIYQLRSRRSYIFTPFECTNTLTSGDLEAGVLRMPPLQELDLHKRYAFYYQIYSLNRLASQLRNKRIFWNAFYLAPFWQIFSINNSQDNQSKAEFYYVRLPYNFLAYFINVEADNNQINCCVNPRIIRDSPPSDDIGINIPIPQLPTPDQSFLLNPYNYVNSKLTTHKPYLIPLYEKFYRRVDKYNFLEPILAYVKGGHVSIIGQYNGIFAYTLPEHTDKVFLAVYRESANELILTIGEDLIMADIVEFEDPSLGILISQENPFVFYKTHITKTGKVVEQQGNQPIVRFVDLP